MNAMARSAESFTAARTWSLVWPALKCDSLSQVEAGCWTNVSLISSTGNTSFVLGVTKSSFLWRMQLWFPFQALQTFTQCQLGIVFPHTLFLLSIRRIPNRSESHRSRPLPEVLFTCFACSALVARLQYFTYVRATSRHIYETPLGLARSIWIGQKDVSPNR